MEFKKLSAPSLKELFVKQVRDSILSGELAIGTRLPPERELAQQMQVSRTVINGGFAELEQQGFLEIRPRQGVFVADYGRTGNLSTLTAIMEYHGESFSHAEIRSILEVRRALEHLATDAAIEHASDKDLLRLFHLSQAVGDATTVQSAIAASFAFHHELSIIGKNNILPLIYISFKPVVTQLWARFCRRYGPEALYESTRNLCECLRARDALAARRYTDAYLDDAIDGNHQIYERV